MFTVAVLSVTILAQPVAKVEITATAARVVKRFIPLFPCFVVVGNLAGGDYSKL
jgi:hypothetical protein